MFAHFVAVDQLADAKGCPDEILIPREGWTDQTQYDKAAGKLAELFQENFQKYAEVRDSGQQTVDNLRESLFAVPAVAELHQAGAVARVDCRSGAPNVSLAGIPQHSAQLLGRTVVDPHWRSPGQTAANGLDQIVRQVGEIAQGLVLDFAVVPVGASQQVRR